MGSAYESIGQMEKAIERYEQCLKLSESINDSTSLANALNNIALAYSSIGIKEKVLESFLRCNTIWNKTGNKAGAATALGNIGYFFTLEGKYKEALVYQEQVLKIREELNDEPGQAQMLANIGATHYRLLDTEKALKCYEKSLALSKKNGLKKRIATAYCHIGNLYDKAGSPLAKKYADSAIKAALEIGFPVLVQNAADLNFRVANGEKNFEKALKMHLLYIQMRDSIKNDENKKNGIKTQLQHDFDKRENENQIRAEGEQKTTDAKFKHEQTLRYALYGGLALLFIFGGFMFNRFRIEKKQKKLIAEKNEETQIQKKEIEHKQKEILDSIHYASRIQRALITQEQYIHRTLTDLKKT